MTGILRAITDVTDRSLVDQAIFVGFTKEQDGITHQVIIFIIAQYLELFIWLAFKLPIQGCCASRDRAAPLLACLIPKRVERIVKFRQDSNVPMNFGAPWAKWGKQQIEGGLYGLYLPKLPDRISRKKHLVKSRYLGYDHPPQTLKQRRSMLSIGVNAQQVRTMLLGDPDQLLHYPASAKVGVDHQIEDPHRLNSFPGDIKFHRYRGQLAGDSITAFSQPDRNLSGAAAW